MYLHTTHTHRQQRRGGSGRDTHPAMCPMGGGGWVRTQGDSLFQLPGVKGEGSEKGGVYTSSILAVSHNQPHPKRTPQGQNGSVFSGIHITHPACVQGHPAPALGQSSICGVAVD